ncbi:hypothetical protein LINPERHAP2_LOCUS41933 [Linum perenne]
MQRIIWLTLGIHLICVSMSLMFRLFVFNIGCVSICLELILRD